MIETKTIKEKGSLTIKTERTPETLTDPESVQPERKKTSTEMKSSRVIVISPYSRLNVYLESEIPKIIEGSYTEIISSAVFNYPPYIDVQTREMHAPTPFWIIDFEHITAEVEKTEIDKELLVKRKKSSLSDIIREYPDKIEANLFSDEFFLEDNKIQTKITDITTKFAQTLDEVLPNLWKKAEDLSKKVKTVIDIVGFNEYYLWTAKKKEILYLTPSSSFSRELREKHVYDSNGNFITNSQFIENYFSDIRKDLVKLAEYGFRSKLNLFFKRL